MNIKTSNDNSYDESNSNVTRAGSPSLKDQLINNLKMSKAGIPLVP
jgi:hypothetical protein